MYTHMKPVRSRFILAVFASMAAFPVLVAAQPLWTVTNAGVFLEGEGRSDEYTNQPVFAELSETRNMLIAGFQGLSYGNRYGFDAVDKNFVGLRESVVVASSKAKATIAGDGTSEVSIEWLIRASTESDALDGFDAQSDATIGVFGGNNFFVELDTTGVPAGTPLIIYYSWDAASRGFNRIEPPLNGEPPDYARVIGATMAINGVDQLGPNYNFDILPPVVSVNHTLINQAGQLNITAGQIVRIDIAGLVESGIYQRGAGFTEMEDAASALFFGKIRLSTGTPPIPVPPGPVNPNPFIDFSVDIGSDTELSALPDGDEVFDPGDVYVWRGPVLPPGGADGYRNDADIFMGMDPFPTPGIAGSGAPICSGLPIGLVAHQFFDLDGHDALEFSLWQLMQNVRLPIPYFDSHCINGADYLLLSLEDDGADPYTLCDIPITTTGPSMMTYGEMTNRDEIFGITLSTSAPAAILHAYPLADEVQVHVSLSPNPLPGSEADDDDVDSLDAPNDPSVCTVWYFSCDHEATGFDAINGAALDPGAIYEVVPGGSPLLVVHPMIHLGIHAGVDLADFAFAWMENTSVPGQPLNLAVIFAVHPDNPSTADDESGGLNPKRIVSIQIKELVRHQTDW